MPADNRKSLHSCPLIHKIRKSRRKAKAEIFDWLAFHNSKRTDSMHLWRNCSFRADRNSPKRFGVWISVVDDLPNGVLPHYMMRNVRNRPDLCFTSDPKAN